MKIYLLLLVKIAIILSLFSFKSDENHINILDYSIIEEENKKGLVNEKGEIVIPAKYDDLGWSKGVFYIIDNLIGYKEDYQWGLIDLDNNKVTKPIYYHLYPYHESLFIAASSESYTREIKYGVINTKGKTEVSFKYEQLNPFQNLLIATENKNGNNTTGVITNKSKVIIPLQYKHISGIGKNNFSVQNEKNKVALFNLDGKQLSGFSYDSISALDNELLLVYRSGKKGLINSSGAKVLDVKYKRIEKNSASQINVLNYPEWTILNSKNEALKVMSYDEIIPLGQNFYKIKAEEGREGVIDAHDELIVPLKDWKILKLKSNLITFKLNNKQGLINTSGQLVIPARFDSIAYNQDFIIASRLLISETRYSLFDTQGKVISNEVYDEIILGQEDLFPVKQKEKWGFINAKGVEVIPCKFDSVGNFKNGKTKVFYLDSYGVIDQKGDWVIKPFYDELHEGSATTYFHKKGRLYTFINEQEENIYRTTNFLSKHPLGFVEKEEDGQSKLIKPDGSSIFTYKFDSISSILNDTILFLFKNKETSIINKRGKLLMPFDKRFQEIYPPSENFIGCKIAGKYGFVDMNGKLRVANQYEAIGKYSEELARVKIMGKWGYIDKQERWVIQPYYDNAFDFKSSIAQVQKNGKYGLINKSGEQVLPLDYNDIEILQSGNYLLFLNNQKGLANDKGKLILYPKYDSLKDLNNGFIIVERAGKKGLISSSGLSTIPMIYDEIMYDDLNNVYLIVKAGTWESINLKK